MIFLIKQYWADAPTSSMDVTGVDVIDCNKKVGTVSYHDRIKNKIKINLTSPMTYNKLRNEGIAVENMISIYEA